MHPGSPRGDGDQKPRWRFARRKKIKCATTADAKSPRPKMAAIAPRERRPIVTRGSPNRRGSSKGRGALTGRIGSGPPAPSGTRSRGPAAREKWFVALRLRPTFPRAGSVAMSVGRREGGQERVGRDDGLRRNDREIGDDLVVPGRGDPGHEPVGPQRHRHPGIEDEPPRV